MSDDTSLEEAFRTGLQRRADDVDTAVDLLGPARSAAAGRRRRAWVAGSVGLAAAALVTAAVVQSVGDEPERGTPVADAPSEPLPTEWRTEAWHGLQVEVPADWGWGGAPDACGVGAVLGCPDGERSRHRPRSSAVRRTADLQHRRLRRVFRTTPSGRLRLARRRSGPR